ncbi:hypothetical protein [Streptomyces specialis]|uniref:hypothetical protein n=1 Tax=Streptomyces specialis TaxID=498367 RepID=UPI00073F26EE|nr:hypothetical protein [Streptomyces specialis]
MTAPYKASLRLEGDGIQWADYGVNVGHDLYGDIHIHPPTPPDGLSRPRRETASPVSETRQAAALSALFALLSACEQAAAALSVFNRPDEAGKEEE